MSRIAKENVREKILEAAENRLWRYGLKKTTIDEIAADAGVGKGTVYLYFDSKEDISLAILSGYKVSVLKVQEAVVANPDLAVIEKIRQFLLLPVIASHDRWDRCPEALELIVALKPHLAAHMKPYVERELALLTNLLRVGSERGELNVPDPDCAARSLKTMTYGLYPPYPFVIGQEEIEREIGAIVNLVMRGLKA